MVRKRDRNAIVVDCLFVDADFQVREGEYRWYVTICDMFHCRLTFHYCQDFIHDGFFRIRKC